jgi:3-phytase
LVAASGRFPSELLLLALDHETSELRFVARYPVELNEPYGICLHRDSDQQPYVFLNSTDGTFVQYAVSPDFSINEARRFKLASQVEGCVVDDSEAVIYIAEELLDSVRGPHLAADVEGLALYQGPRKLLIASSQGDNSYAVYDAETAEHLLSFHVTGISEVDGVTHTDGLDVTAASLPGYPHGILVVQDDDNTNPTQNQNFKIVSFADVLDIIEQRSGY